MAWNDDLKEQALEIASSNETPLRVVAGPGTGKTFALKRRVARLLEEGENPGQILVVTFTRVAAKDLEREIESLNAPGVENVQKGTLHSFCLSLLNNADVIRITGRRSRILLNFETRFLLEDIGITNQIQFNEDYYHRRRRLRAFEAAWAREQNQEPGWPLDENDRHFQGILHEWLVFHEAMLVGELVPLSLNFLRNNPTYHGLRNYKHILVDEYQDLNRAEQHLVDLLSKNANLTIVGDEDQSIYESFRYAHPEGISHFDRQHPNTYDIPLSICRRCPTIIVSMANELISNNLRRLKHPLFPKKNNENGNVHIIQWKDLNEEIEGLAEFISQKVSIGEFDPGQTLVLCPRKQFGFAIRNALRKKGCLAFSFFQEELLEGNPKENEDSAAQQAFTLLRLLVNQDDAVALRCWLGFGSPSLRAKEYERIKNYCSMKGLSLWKVLHEIESYKNEIPNTTATQSRFQLLVTNLGRLKRLPLRQLVDELFPGDEIWAEPFRQIIVAAENEILDTNALLDLLLATITQPEMPSKVDYVRIMSLHKSKGLNADHVIITGCVEGILPKHKDSELPFENQMRNLEEQRRLFYVALTRAKKTLVISSFLHMPRDFAHRMRVKIIGGDEHFANTLASTFLSELGPNAPRPRDGQEWLKDQLIY